MLRSLDVTLRLRRQSDALAINGLARTGIPSAKPYVSGSETPAPSSETDVPADAKPAQPYVPGSETDVPDDAKPAQPVQLAAAAR
jgi:hypothetical protein